MISALDIISYDTRPLDTAPHTAVVDGPTFAEQLSRAEDDRTRANPDYPEEAGRSNETLKAAEYRKNDQASRQLDSSASDPDGLADGRKEAASTKPGQTETKSKSTGNAKHGAPAADDTVVSKSGRKSRSGIETTKTDADAGRKPEGTRLDESVTSLLHQDAADATKTDESAGEAADDPASAVLKHKSRQEEESGAAELLVSQEQRTAVAAELVGSAGKNDDLLPGKKLNAGQSRIKAEKRLSEADSSAERKRADTPRIELKDLRQNRVAAHTRTDASDGKAEARPSSFSLSVGGETEQVHRQEVMVLETRSTGGDGTQPRADAMPSRAAGELAKALREGGNNEILKRAQFLLKDNNQGEIRLILKPERLGEVRIRLNLNDRHIAGRIIVENNSVREAFQENIEALNRTFRENGFQTAGLDVSVGDSESGAEERRGRMDSRGKASRLAEILDEQVPRADADIYPMSTVNVYV